MEGANPISPEAPSIEFSLQNGLAFQAVLENPSRYNLSPTDKLLLEDGRDSMATRTRYGFLIGATLSPLPLFRGQYAINNLRHLPPLMDPLTQRPNPTVIRARLFWIAQSIVLTTIGSGLGTWIGFKIGLKSMERKLNSVPGCRERILLAFSQAQRELENHQLQHRSPLTSDLEKPSIISSQNSSMNETEDENLFRESEETTPRATTIADPSNSKTPNPTVSRSNQTPSSSRWEELRRAPQSHPSTWQTIREQNTTRPASIFSSSDQSINSNNLEPRSINELFPTPQTQEDFEKLLDRERNLSAGASPQSAERRFSSPSKSP